jgi:C4-type Zn-finger protein
VSFILEDPHGNSAIISDRAERSTYSIEPAQYD